MPPESFTELLAEVEARAPSGWDFSWLGERMTTAPPPWDYDRMLEERAAAAEDMLDIGTGGGERLSRLQARPARTIATEAWPPNVDVAGARLRPLGVTVVAVEPAPPNAEQARDEARGRLPFPRESFGLIACRHEAFVAREITRLLVSGGVFLTQQVGGDCGEFYDLLGLLRPAQQPWTLEIALDQVSAGGLRPLEAGEGGETATFADVGAFAWYLKAVPWAVPRFSAPSHRAQLERLHRRIESDGPVHVRLPAFWLAAERPHEG